MDNLLHAATLDSAALGERRVVQMPALHVSMREVVDALARLYGTHRAVLVRHELQDCVQRPFASYPPLGTCRAESLGVHQDGTIDALARHATGG